MLFTEINAAAAAAYKSVFGRVDVHNQNSWSIYYWQKLAYSCHVRTRDDWDDVAKIIAQFFLGSARLGYFLASAQQKSGSTRLNYFNYGSASAASASA